MVDCAFKKKNTENFASLWCGPKPPIVKLHRYAAPGGSNIAFEAAALRLAQRIADVPHSHLAMHKMVVNRVTLTMDWNRHP